MRYEKYLLKKKHGCANLHLDTMRQNKTPNRADSDSHSGKPVVGLIHSNTTQNTATRRLHAEGGSFLDDSEGDSKHPKKMPSLYFNWYAFRPFVCLSSKRGVLCMVAMIVPHKGPLFGEEFYEGFQSIQ